MFTTKIEMIKKQNIIVSLIKWQGGLWYFEVTEEVANENSQWIDCRVLKRTLPIIPLKFLGKILIGSSFKKVFQWRSKQLWNRHYKKLNKK